MKLLSCKIENFGMLHGVEHRFDAPLHIIEAENGAGKTTLAAFLKAMLYGFSGKGRSLDDNERKRYLPWQGGRFGGTLTFEAGGHTYLLERFFGQTPKGDTFALYDAETNLPSAAFSPSVGEELFGIDAEAFARTTFFTWQKEEKTEANNSIHAKLNDLLDATDDIGDYDAAIARLEIERKIYEKRGNGGRLAELEEEIFELSVALQGAAEAETAYRKKALEIEACRGEKEAAEGELATLRAEDKEKQKREKQRGAAMQLLRYEKEIMACEAEMEQAKASVGRVDVPREMFAPALQEAKTAYETYKLASLQAEDARREYAALIQAHEAEGALPSEEALADISEAVIAYTALATAEDAPADIGADVLLYAGNALHEAEAALDAYREAEGAYRRAAQAEGAEETPPTEEALSQIQTRIQRLRTWEGKLREQRAVSANAKHAHKKKTTGAVLAVGGTLFLVMGVLGLIFFGSIPLYLSLSVAACVCAVLLLTLGIRKLAGGAEVFIAIQGEMIREEDIASEQAALDAFFEGWHLLPPTVSGVDYETLLSRLAERTSAHKAYLLSKAEMEEQNRVCQMQMARLRDAIASFANGSTPDETLSAAAHVNWARTEIAKAELRGAHAETQRKRREETKTAAETALAPYPYAKGETLTARLAALREAVTTHAEQQKQLTQRRQRMEACCKAAEHAKVTVGAFLTRFECKTADELGASLQAAENARRDYENASARKAARIGERAQYMAEERIREDELPTLLMMLSAPAERDTATEEREAVLQTVIDAKKAALYQMETALANLRGTAEKAPFLTARRTALEEELRAATHTRELIALTKAYLEGAKTELSTRYLRTMEDAFLRYFRLVAPLREEGIRIDAELVPHVELGGTRYPVEAFSRGLRDLLGLCMRLALTDSMYAQSAERPPLILDDPFVNLDKEKLSKAKALLDNLCETYQVVYFTCHESRAMK